MNIFYEFAGIKHSIYDENVYCNSDLYNRISINQNIPKDLFKISLNGKYLSSDSSLIEKKNDLFISLSLPLLGGKGGFGSMLRAIGAQIEKTTNKEACRDLSGRRLRDVNAEKRIKNWIRKKAEQAKELERQKREKLERMTQQPRVDFKDDDYLKEKDVIPQKVDDAIDYVLKKKSKKVTPSTVSSAQSSSIKSSSTDISSTKTQIDENNQPCSSSSESIEPSNSDSNSTDSNGLVSSSVNEPKLDQPTSSDCKNSQDASSNRSSSLKSSIMKPIINKRKTDEPAVVCKKKKVQLWLGDDLDSDDSEEE